DSALSETMDAGLIQIARSDITPGISLPPTTSSTQFDITVEDINDLVGQEDQSCSTSLSSNSPTCQRDDKGLRTSARSIELEDFLERSPSDLGPVAFFNVFAQESPRGRFFWNSRYEFLYEQALKSQDTDIYEIGQQMKKNWNSDTSNVELYWDELERKDGLEQDTSVNQQVDGRGSGTSQLSGPILPSQSSGSEFLGSIPTSDSARSSLNPSDFRFMNRLVGPGETCSSLSTTDQLEVGDKNVSALLMKARRDNVKRQSELSDVSELLTLNFIFDERFLAANLSSEMRTAVAKILKSGDFVYDFNEEVNSISQATMFASDNKYFATKEFILSLPSATLVKNILMEMTSTATLFMPRSSLPTNEDSYIHNGVRAIIVG
ncbi:hypothetical protein BGX27_002409, partial [Mortierella sp. AM989]